MMIRKSKVGQYLGVYVLGRLCLGSGARIVIQGPLNSILTRISVIYIVERVIDWIKECRRIFTPFEKTTKNY